MSIEVIPADSKQERERFMRLPWQLYKDFAGWVPNLLMLQRDTFSMKKNPFFDHGEAQLFLAMENGLFFAATSTTYGMPMVVELGVALDVLVGVVILGIFFFQIREQFDSLDLHHMESLKED